MSEQQDYKLLEWLKKGSLEAYEVLFKKYYKVLCLQAILLLGDNVAAEDLVQELFIEFWSKKSYRQIDYSLKAYLYRAVRNKCINRIRKNKVLKEKKYSYKEYRLKERRTMDVEENDLAEYIHCLVQELPVQRMRAFTLVYMENKKYQEAADEMGISINSVKTHLKLALRVLRERLESFR